MKKNQYCIACGSILHPWFIHSPYTYLVCTLCTTNQIDPIPSEKTIKDHYRNKFLKGNYFLARKFANEYRRVLRQFVTKIVAVYAAKNTSIKGKNVLDIGCFTGDFLELMQQEGAEVYGTELQKEAVEIASAKLPGRIFQADIGTKEFPKKKFEIVTILGLIEHVTQPDELLTSIDTIIQPNGLLVIQTPNAESSVAKILGKWWPPLAPVEHIHIFSAKGLTKILIKHGYTDIRVKAHIKWLPLTYIYNQFSNFGPHFYTLLSPIGGILQRLPAWIVIPLYGGEMIVTAFKKPQVVKK